MPALAGRVALVTGVSRRIARSRPSPGGWPPTGPGLVHSWSPHDAEQPWGVDAGGAESLVPEILQAGGRAEHLAADLADPDAPHRPGRRRAHRVRAASTSLVANHARSSAQSLEQLTAAELDL